MSQNEYGYTQKRRSSTDKIPLFMLLIFLAGIILLDKILKFGLNWVDYTIVGIVFFCAFVGYVKGLIGAVFSLVGYVAAVVCAVLFSEPVAVFIMDKTRIGEAVTESLQGLYSDLSVQTFNQSVDISGIQNNIPDELQDFFRENTMFQHLFDNVNPLKSGSEAISNVVTSITDILVFSILKVIAIIAVFFIVKLAILIVGRLVNSLISQSNFLSTTNKTIGLALGAISGCLVVFVAVTYIIPFIDSMNIIRMPLEYQNSMVLGWLFSSSPPAP